MMNITEGDSDDFSDISSIDEHLSIWASNEESISSPTIKQSPILDLKNLDKENNEPIDFHNETLNLLNISPINSSPVLSPMSNKVLSQYRGGKKNFPSTPQTPYEYVYDDDRTPTISTPTYTKLLLSNYKPPMIEANNRSINKSNHNNESSEIEEDDDETPQTPSIFHTYIKIFSHKKPKTPSGPLSSSCLLFDIQNSSSECPSPPILIPFQYSIGGKKNKMIEVDDDDEEDDLVDKENKPNRSVLQSSFVQEDDIENLKSYYRKSSLFVRDEVLSPELDSTPITVKILSRDTSF